MSSRQPGNVLSEDSAITDAVGALVVTETGLEDGQSPWAAFSTTLQGNLVAHGSPNDLGLPHSSGHIFEEPHNDKVFVPVHCSRNSPDPLLANVQFYGPGMSWLWGFFREVGTLVCL